MAKSQTSVSLSEIVIKAQRVGVNMRPIGQTGAVFYLAGGGSFHADNLEQAEAFVEGVRAGRTLAGEGEREVQA